MGMASTLYRFQRRALAWMQSRERNEEFSSLKFTENQLNLIGLTKDDKLAPVRGGLLADEMGLGKTVVSIALILESKNLMEKHMEIPATLTKKNSVNSPCSDLKMKGGTLVVCPPALVQQWVSEIREHVGDLLRVEVYCGLSEEARIKEVHNNFQHQVQDGKRIRRKVQALNKGHVKMYGRVTAQMIREAEMYTRMQSGELEPTVDMNQVAQDTAEKFKGVDVIITSFDVLQREVHYDSSHSQRRLRHPKRYAVPDSPLLRLEWFRVIVDEAQMVGPFSNVGEMMGKIQSRHRWCVSGTPMSSGNELNDLRGMLTILQHGIFSALLPPPLKSAWMKCIAEPLQKGCLVDNMKNKEGDTILRAWEAWELLCTTLRQIGWRNTKNVVVAEMSLPPRNMQLQMLRFHPAEIEFYSRIKDELRKNKEECERFQDTKIDKKGKGNCVQTSPERTKNKKHRRVDKVDEAKENTRQCLSQLRLACIHPQLTQYWSRLMSTDLQLGQGGIRSLEEILERLVEKQAEDLQEAERRLCTHLNALGMLLLQPHSGNAGQNNTREEYIVSDAEEHNTHSLSPPCKKKRRIDVPPQKEAIRQAIHVLETSFKICEKGIDAAGVPLCDLHKINDPTSTVAATWMAWKRVQINVAHQLSEAYKLSGEYSDSDIKKFEIEEKKRSNELRESAEQQFVVAFKALREIWENVDRLLKEMDEYYEKSLNQGFPSLWGTPPSSGVWLAIREELLLPRLKAYCGENNSPNEEDLEKSKEILKNSLIEMDKVESMLQQDVSRLEAWKTSRDIDDGLEDLQQKLSSVGESAPQEATQELRWKMGSLIKLLPNHKENKLRNRYERILPIPLPKYRRRQRLDEEKDFAGSDAKWDAFVLGYNQEKANSLEPHNTTRSFKDSTENDVKIDIILKDAANCDTNKPFDGSILRFECEIDSRNQTKQLCCICKAELDVDSISYHQIYFPLEKISGQETGFLDRRPGLDYWYDFEHELVEDLVPHDEVTEIHILDMAAKLSPYIPSETWKGRLPSNIGVYVFKTDHLGTGYYFQHLEDVRNMYSEKEKPHPMQSLNSSVQECGLIVSNALQQQSENLMQRLGADDLHLLKSLSTDAIASRLKVAEAQLNVIRSIKTKHKNSEQRLLEKLKNKHKADLEAESAANSLLIGSVIDRDMLQRKIESLFIEAKSLKQKRTYAKNQLNELTQDTVHEDVTGTENTDRMTSPLEYAQRSPDEDKGSICLKCFEHSKHNHTMDTSNIPGGFIGPTETKVEDHGRECPVCREVMKGEGFIWELCSHSFCISCTETMFQGRFSANCPVCRMRHTRNQTIRVLANRRPAQDAACYDMALLSDRNLASIKVKGQWSSKIEAVVRRILALSVDAPDEKVLVFSQFPDALKVLRRALMMNDVRYVELSANRKDCDRALKIFHTEDSVKALLLSLRRGAHGLTLTRANHVVLLEPALEPAIEQQAISRVHRVGQKRPVRILRFIVEQSIEEEVLRIQEERHVGMMQDSQEAGGTTGDLGAHLSLADGIDEEPEAPTTVPSLMRKENLNEDDAQRLMEAVLV